MQKLHIALALLSTFGSVDLARAKGSSEALLKCVTTSSSNDEKIDLARWVLVSFALNPLVSTVNSIPAGMMTEVRQRASEVFVKIITDRCREESISALKSGQTGAFGKAFTALRSAAGRSLAEDPRVMDSLNAVSMPVVNDQRFKAFVQTAKAFPRRIEMIPAVLSPDRRQARTCAAARVA